MTNASSKKPGASSAVRKPRESCLCDSRIPIRLMATPSRNAISCMKCNLVVDNTGLHLSTTDRKSLVKWRKTYWNIYSLWLDSGEYEDWAAEKLQSFQGQVNSEGRQLARRILGRGPCFYWLFWDETNELAYPRKCPSCQRDWSASPFRSGESICKSCRLVCASPL